MIVHRINSFFLYRWNIQWHLWLLIKNIPFILTFIYIVNLSWAMAPKQCYSKCIFLHWSRELLCCAHTYNVALQVNAHLYSYAKSPTRLKLHTFKYVGMVGMHSILSLINLHSSLHYCSLQSVHHFPSFIPLFTIVAFNLNITFHPSFLSSLL